MTVTYITMIQRWRTPNQRQSNFNNLESVEIIYINFTVLLNEIFCKSRKIEKTNHNDLKTAILWSS